MASLKEKLQRKKREGQRPQELEREKDLIQAFKPAKPISLADRNRKAAARKKTPEPDKWTSEQVDNRTSEQASGHLSRQLSEQVNKWTSGQLSEQEDKCTSEQVDKRTSAQVDNRASEQVDNRTSEQVAPVVPPTKSPDLRPNQHQILKEIYFRRPFKVSGPDRIGKNIAYGTVRNCLKSLQKKGYISKPFSINDGVNKGTTCQVDEAKCLPLFGPSPIANSEQVDKCATEQVDNRASAQVSNRASEQVDNRTSAQVAGSNSSSSLNNSLLLARALENALASNPDLAYWRRKNLKVRRVENWMTETGMELDDMIESLAHCAFEMTRSGEKDRKGTPITSVLDWFWRRIETHHYYDQPAGYASAEERKLERAKKRLAEKQARAKELTRLRQAEEEAELEIRFEEMMKKPEGDLYRQCYENMSAFHKSRAKTKKGIALAMRREFDKVMAGESGEES